MTMMVTMTTVMMVVIGNDSRMRLLKMERDKFMCAMAITIFHQAAVSNRLHVPQKWRPEAEAGLELKHFVVVFQPLTKFEA